MLKITPEQITDSNLTSSTIAEPDVSCGEVEWVDQSILEDFGSYTGSQMAATMAGDGFIYGVGTNGTVLKVDTTTKSVSEFGSYTGTYLASALAIDGDIYCVGLSGNVMQISIPNQTVSTFAAASSVNETATLAGDGFIYCVSSGSILKINTGTKTTSLFGSFTGSYYAAALANDGHIYCVGNSGLVLKINTVSNTVSTFGAYSGVYASASLGADGNVYCTGASGTVLKINIPNQSVSVFGSYPSTYTSMQVGLDGFIYCVGYSLTVMKIDTSSKSVSFFGAYANKFCSAIDSSGAIYCAGESDVIEIKAGYIIGDQVVKSSAHKTYQAAVSTSEDPETGVLSTPPSWVVVGSTNKYKMFDYKISSVTKSDTTIVVVAEPKDISNLAVSAFNLTGVSSVNVTIVSLLYGEIYNNTISMVDNSAIVDAWAWYSEPIIARDRFILADMQFLSGSTVTVTFTGSDMEIGDLIIGDKADIGVANYNTSIQILNFSSQTRNDFGEFEIVKRDTADLVKFDVTIPESRVGYVRNLFARSASDLSVYVGDSTNASDPTVVFGLYENYENVIGAPNQTQATITIQGKI